MRHRPKFNELLERIGNLLADGARYQYLTLSNGVQEKMKTQDYQVCSCRNCYYKSFEEANKVCVGLRTQLPQELHSDANSNNRGQWKFKYFYFILRNTS